MGFNYIWRQFHVNHIFMLKKDVLWLLLCMAIAVAMRFFSFFPSVINHDESTYIVIANALTKGYVYFVDFIDTKPPGVFMLLAGIIKLVGNSVFAIRFSVAVLIAITAFLLYKAKIKQTGNYRAAKAASVIYIMALSVFTFYGVSVNTELFFNFFTAAALLVFWYRKNNYQLIWVGFLLGIGFVIKYMVLLDAFAIGLYVLIKKVAEKQFSGRLLWQLSLFTLAFFVPFAILMLYYKGIGYLPDLLFYTFHVSKNYSVETTFWSTLKFVLDFHIRFLPIVLMAVLVIVQKRKQSYSHFSLFYLLWYFSVIIAVILPGKTFGHYFIQLMLPLSFIAADLFIIYPKLIKTYSYTHNKLIFKFLVIIFIVGNMFLQKKDYYDKPDYPSDVAAYLASKLNSDDVLYTGGCQHIIYFLLDTESPTAYVHRSILSNPELCKALNVNKHEAYTNIKVKQPAYMLFENDKQPSDLSSYTKNNYELDTVVQNKVFIYRRKAEN